MGDSGPVRVRELRGVGSLEVDMGVMDDVDLWGAGVLCGLRPESFHRARCPMVEAGRRVELDAEGG